MEFSVHQRTGLLADTHGFQQNRREPATNQSLQRLNQIQISSIPAWIKIICLHEIGLPEE